MPSRTPCLPQLLLTASIALGAAFPAHAQSGLRATAGPEGLDPAFAVGWHARAPYELGYIPGQWKHGIGFAPSQTLRWSYAFGEGSSLGLSYTGAKGLSYQASGLESSLGLFGRYSLAPDWSVSAEAGAPAGSLRLNDLRIGLRRRF